MKTHAGYPVWSWYDHIDAYVDPENGDDWLSCAHCGLKPHVWTFDNGRYTACGCHDGKYRTFAILAESICSVMKRTNGSMAEYDQDELRKNWNHYVLTGGVVFGRKIYEERW